MTFNAEQFLLDYNIEYWDTGKNVSPGWISINCCMGCGDNSNHGAFEIKTGRYSCFRCGTHWAIKAIANLTNTSFNQAKKIQKKYSDHIYIDKKQQPDHIYINKITFPSGTQQLTKKAKEYLIGRDFDPEYLAKEWGLMSTGNTGEYKFCILAPIYLNGRLISYQCRDITDKATTPYRPCHIDQSVYNFEYSLYGIDKAINRLDKSNKRKCIVVEGITDVWRLGPGAVATFGINFTNQQISLLKKSFDEIFILFDPEDIAQEKADQIYNLLRGFGKKVEVFTLESGDPGSLPDNEAKKITGELL